MAIATTDMVNDDNNDEDDRAVLEVLSGGRANPYLIREETGLNKTDVNTILNRLGRSGYLLQVTRGLYEITERGRNRLEELEDE